VAGIGLFHGSLREVIMVRIVLMAVMLALVALPFLRRYKKAELVEAV
jgi:hypothetical protein